MSSDISRLIHSMLNTSAGGLQPLHWSPAVDVYRIAEGWLIKFDLAGVRPADIRVAVGGRKLTVSGRRRDWVVEESHTCSAYSMEITYSQFERTLELPCEIGHLRIATDYRDGMLLVHLQEQGRTG